jgi:hypothetical protein
MVSSFFLLHFLIPFYNLSNQQNYTHKPPHTSPPPKLKSATLGICSPPAIKFFCKAQHNEKSPLAKEERLATKSINFFKMIKRIAAKSILL